MTITISTGGGACELHYDEGTRAIRIESHGSFSKDEARLIAKVLIRWTA